ncbi:MAG: hypothetical protein D6704_05010 [Nitrospirae bacterium]|nr:MAG: hypothetical protein D6704_05010 [Nitrospirota bacterium]
MMRGFGIAHVPIEIGPKFVDRAWRVTGGPSHCRGFDVHGLFREMIEVLDRQGASSGVSMRA